jgi:NHLM bacteriocin system ABC transporter peptidase/ATP-binding protein
MSQRLRRPHGLRRARGRRIKTPTVLQMEAVECGAAALGIVLGYYGRVVPLEELRAACGVSRDGSRANNVLKAARAYGLIAKGFRKEPADLRAERLPVIVFWNFNHFVVVEGFKDDRVYLNDPASGPRTVTTQEFDQSFTGVALVFEPGPEFVRQGEPPSLVRGLRRHLRGAETALVFALLAGLGLAFTGIVIPAFTQVFVDAYLVRHLGDWVVPLLIGMALTAALRAGFAWLQQYCLYRTWKKLTLTSSASFFWHVLRLPVGFFTQRYGGEVGSRVLLNDRVSQLLAGDIAINMLNVVMIVFFAVVMLQYDVVLTLITIGMAVVNFVALRVVSRRRIDSNRRLMREQGRLNGLAMGGLQMVETLKATGTDSDFFAHWAGYQAKSVNAQQELGVTSTFLDAVPPFLTAVNTAVILAIGGFRVMDGLLTVGELVAFQSLSASFMDPVNKLVSLGSTLQEIEGTMNRLDDILGNETDAALDVAEPVGGVADGQPKLSGDVAIRGLSFGYSRLDPPLITDFDLTLRPGARVALVGGSGSGKSTVARLVSGLYEPWSGEILFDGKPRTAYPRSVVANSVAVVDQDIFLFDGTVRDNLTLWDATLADTTVVRAAHDASIHADIAARVGGYDSVVAEGGFNYSGGQRQRLEIARALAVNPSILVLDEATSALDPVTEQAIDENLRRRGCTCLIVAHRLSTIRDCDEIIVLERGSVVQRGTHDQLSASDGPYARLISSS